MIDVTVVLSTVEMNFFSGNMWPQVQVIREGQEDRPAGERRRRYALTKPYSAISRPANAFGSVSIG